MARRSPSEAPALELVEDAIRLLRSLPASTWLVYAAGAVPFGLGALYFFAEMSQSAFAMRDLPAAALGMALLFGWLKTCQAVFAARMRSQLLAQDPEPLGWRGWLTTAVDQAAVQPWGLLLLPLASLTIISFPWVFGFFQSATVLGAVPSETSLVDRAWKEARRWPSQGVVLVFQLALAGSVLMLNSLIAFITGPQLLKTLLGVETIFTRSVGAVFNTTLTAALLMLAWLLWDPLVKAVFTLRCFNGQSRTNGDDLRARLRRAAVAMALGAVMIFGATMNSDAADSQDKAPAAGYSVEQLNSAIKETLDDSRYAWRMPKDEQMIEEAGRKTWIGRLADWFGERTKGLLKRAGDILGDIVRWVFGPPKVKKSSNVDFADLGTILRGLLVVLCVAIVIALVYLIVKAFLKQPKVVTASVQTASAMPDLRDENVGAEQLPEDGWLQLAADLTAKGELRLALRALYLASLAHLARRELIRLARFKSNRDYERELRRRARPLPVLVETFGDCVGRFEQVWYGSHTADPAALADYRSKVERLRSC